MNKTLKRIFCGLLMVMAVVAGADADDWGQFQRYEDHNRRITADSVSPRVVFMGNSITEGWPEKRPEFFKDNNFVGRGISGQTSYQMLLRFRDDVINLHPEYVVINAGTNDIAENNHNYSEERTLGNIISMVELAQANGIKPILSAVLPCSGFYWRKTIKNVPQKIRSLNHRIREYAEANNIAFIDYFTPLADSGKGLDKSYTSDGVHPNADGYKVMENAFMEIFMY